MNPVNQILSYGSIIISIFSLVASAISLSVSLKKYRIEKSILRCEIMKVKLADVTAAYPSMENGDSKYVIEILITNSGYRPENIVKIKSYYKRSNNIVDFNKRIAEKTTEVLNLEYKRKDILALKKIEIIPLEDKTIYTKSLELKKWQEEVLRHVKKIDQEWENGKKKD